MTNKLIGKPTLIELPKNEWKDGVTAIATNLIYNILYTVGELKLTETLG